MTWILSAEPTKRKKRQWEKQSGDIEKNKEEAEMFPAFIFFLRANKEAKKSKFQQPSSLLNHIRWGNHWDQENYKNK